MTPILDTLVALDCRHHQSSKKSHQRNREGHARCLPRIERRKPPKTSAEKSSSHNATDETFNGLRRRYFRRNLVAPDKFSEHVLQHIARLADQKQENHQKRGAACV